MARKAVDPHKIEVTRGLRREQTSAERILCNKLRSLQLDGTKFRRQHPIGDYVVDFVNLEKELIIEIDGGQHNENSVSRKDEKRTQWLKREGYRVLRFWNNDISTNMEGVWLSIQEELR